MSFLAPGFRRVPMLTCRLASLSSCSYGWRTFATGASGGTGSIVHHGGNVQKDTTGTATTAAPTTSIPSSADAIIIGGGVAGCSALYHLTKLGMKNVILLERSKLTSGSTWHSAGIVWRYSSSSDVAFQLVDATRSLVATEKGNKLLVDSSGVDPGWVQNGAMFVTTAQERLNELKRVMTLGKFLGIDYQLLTPPEVKDLYPLMNVTDIKGAIYSAEDGAVEPSGLTTAYARAAVKEGAKIVEDCRVMSIKTKLGFNSSRQVSAVHTDLGAIQTSCVVNCAGAWAPSVGSMVGVTVPLQTMKRSYVISDSVDGVRGCPSVRDAEAGMYVKTQGDRILMGAHTDNPTFVDDLPSDFNFSLYDFDWDTFTPRIAAAIHRVPILETLAFKSKIYGPEAFTPDFLPLMGESPDVRGFYLSCAYNGSGIMLSGGCGQQIAEWIVHGRPSLNMAAYDISRFHPSYNGNKKWLRERVHEMYTLRNRIPYPNFQPLSERDLIIDSLHQTLLDAGCVYEVSNGWERPAWFTTSGGSSKVNSYTDDHHGDHQEERHPGQLSCDLQQQAVSSSSSSTDKLEILPYDYYGAYGHDLHKDYPYRDQALKLDHSFTQHPGCHEQIAAEYEAAHSGAAVFNLSSSGKFWLTGKDAAKAIDWLCTNDIHPEGRVIPTCMLNKYGGVEAVVTVTNTPNRISDHAITGDGDTGLYFIVSGSATANRVLQHINHVLQDEKFDATVQDVSRRLGCLNLRGPACSTIIEQVVTPANLQQLTEEAENTYLAAVIGGHNLWLAKSETGYTMHIPPESMTSVYAQLLAAAKASSCQLVNAGYRAMHCISLELNQCSWGVDVDYNDTPLEAGLQNTLSSSAEKSYLGKEAVERQLRDGVKRRRFVLVTQPDSPVILHGKEGVFCDGRLVSIVRNAGYSHRLQRSIGTAYIPKDPNMDINDGQFLAEGGEFEVDCMGVRYPVQVYLSLPLH